jgi:Uma2 family endonuclease
MEFDAMATAATKLLTADEFWDWSHLPENRDRHCELEKGEVVDMVPPGYRHGVLCTIIASILWNYARAHRFGMVCSNDTGVILERDPDTVKGPDVALFHGQQSYSELETKYSPQLPVLAVEVLSPTDRYSKTVKRVRQFLKSGIVLVWVVDPEDRTVTVHRRGVEPRIYEVGEALTNFEELPGFVCKVDDIFLGGD